MFVLGTAGAFLLPYKQTTERTPHLPGKVTYEKEADAIEKYLKIADSCELVTPYKNVEKRNTYTMSANTNTFMSKVEAYEKVFARIRGE